MRASFLLCGQVAEGVRWMPWYQEPMKDVGGRDRPGGAVNLAVIPGRPNGVTYNESCVSTCIVIHRVYGVNAGKLNISVPVGRENNSDSVSSGERKRIEPKPCV